MVSSVHRGESSIVPVDPLSESTANLVHSNEAERQKQESGQAHFRRLGWKRLTVVLIVESIALGALSLPRSFATLGMILGVTLCISIGLIAVYTGTAGPPDGSAAAQWEHTVAILSDGLWVLTAPDGGRAELEARGAAVSARAGVAAG